MEILLWLAFPAAVTTIAMIWAAWAGRGRRRSRFDDDSAAYERFAAAVLKPHPTRGRSVPPAPVQPAGGVAVRRSADDERQSPPRDGRRRGPMRGFMP